MAAARAAVVGVATNEERWDAILAAGVPYKVAALVALAPMAIAAAAAAP